MRLPIRYSTWGKDNPSSVRGWALAWNSKRKIINFELHYENKKRLLEFGKITKDDGEIDV
jgi:hypothetical protein